MEKVVKLFSLVHIIRFHFHAISEITTQPLHRAYLEKCQGLQQTGKEDRGETKN